MITISTRPTRRQLDEQGLWLFWRDHPDGRGRQGFVCQLWACTAPACACPELVGLGRWLDDRVASVRAMPGDPELQLDTVAGADPDDPAYGFCAFRWDRRTGAVAPQAGPDDGFAALAVWLAAEFDDELRAALAHAVERGRQNDQPPDPWTGWRPGDLVAFDAHFPDEAFAPLGVHGARYFVDDLHCIAPDCPCTDVRLVFRRFGDDACSAELVFAGTLVVTLPGLTPQDVAAAPGALHGRQGVLAAWRHFVHEHQDLAAILARRRQRIRQVRPPARTTARAAAGPTRRRPRPGRNDRCPCGSGRKWKNCCGAG